MKQVRRALCQEHVAHQFPLAHLRDDAKRLRNSAQPAFLLEEPLGKRVIGQDKALARRHLVLELDAVQHFATRLFGKRQQQDLFGRHPQAPKPAIALYQDAGFAGSSARHDQQRSLRVRHRDLLGLGQRRRDHRDGPV